MVVRQLVNERASAAGAEQGFVARRPDIGAQEVLAAERGEHDHLRAVGVAPVVLAMTLLELRDEDVGEELAVVAEAAEPAGGVKQAAFVERIEAGASSAATHSPRLQGEASSSSITRGIALPRIARSCGCASISCARNAPAGTASGSRDERAMRPSARKADGGVERQRLAQRLPAQRVGPRLAGDLGDQRRRLAPLHPTEQRDHHLVAAVARLAGRLLEQAAVGQRELAHRPRHRRITLKPQGDQPPLDALDEQGLAGKVERQARFARPGSADHARTSRRPAAWSGARSLRRRSPHRAERRR